MSGLPSKILSSLGIFPNIVQIYIYIHVNRTKYKKNKKNPKNTRSSSSGSPLHVWEKREVSERMQAI